MGFKSENILDDPRIPDGPHLWDTDVVKEIVKNHIASLKTNQNVEIGAIVTFDEGGVSWHPNHISCYLGCKKLYD